MATEPAEARLARLEGGYEQIDRRLGSLDERLGRLEVKVDALGQRLDAKIDGVASELRRGLGALGSRMHTVLRGIIVAILVPILIRVFFP